MIVNYTLITTPNEKAHAKAQEGHEEMTDILTEVLESQTSNYLPDFIPGSVTVTATG